MAYNKNADGTFRPFTAAEITAFGLETADVKDGANPTFRLEPSGASVTMPWSCNWDQIDNVTAYFLGAAGIYADSSGTHLSRAMPQAFPRTGWENYRAMAVETLTGSRSPGRNDLRGVPAYKKAKLNVRYELVFFELHDDDEGQPEYDRYTSILPSTTDINFLQLPGSCLRFLKSSGAGEPHGRAIPYSVGKPEVVSKIGFKWWRVPATAWQPGMPLYKRIKGDPVNGIKSMIGMVNKTSFLGRPPGTLNFAGVDEEIVPDLVDGTFCFNLTFWMLEKNATAIDLTGAGWNHLFFAGIPSGINGLDVSGYYFAGKQAAWEAAGSLTAGKCLFDETEFSEIWNVGGS